MHFTGILSTDLIAMFMAEAKSVNGLEKGLGQVQGGMSHDRLKPSPTGWDPLPFPLPLCSHQEWVCS